MTTDQHTVWKMVSVARADAFLLEVPGLTTVSQVRWSALGELRNRRSRQQILIQRVLVDPLLIRLISHWRSGSLTWSVDGRVMASRTQTRLQFD